MDRQKDVLVPPDYGIHNLYPSSVCPEDQARAGTEQAVDQHAIMIIRKLSFQICLLSSPFAFFKERIR